MKLAFLVVERKNSNEKGSRKLAAFVLEGEENVLQLLLEKIGSEMLKEEESAEYILL